MKARVATYLNSDGEFVLTSMKYRNQDDNVKEVLSKLTYLMREAADAANVHFPSSSSLLLRLSDNLLQGRLSKDEEKAQKMKRNELKRKKRTLEKRDAL